MRNSYPGICYRCGELCKAKEGHFERYRGSWRVQHARCAIEARRKREAANDANKIKQRLEKAGVATTGN